MWKGWAGKLVCTNTVVPKAAGTDCQSDARFLLVFKKGSGNNIRLINALEE